VSSAALTKTDDANVTLTLGGSPTNALLQATSLTLGWTGVLSTTRGGLNASSTPTSGTILRGNGTGWVSTTATYPNTATAAGTLLRADGTNWVPSTATFPNVATSAGTLLVADGTNWIATTATYPVTAGTSGTLLTSNGSGFVNTTATYPSTATTSGAILRANGTNWIASTAAYPNTATSAGTFLVADGTNWVATTATYPSTAGANGSLLRSNGTNWVATTAIFLNTYPINVLLYASSANVITGLATANDGALITSSGGVPSISSTLPSAVQNNITAVNSAANTLSIGGFTKTFTGAAANVAASANVSSWTPGVAFGGGTTGITYGFQSGQYSTTTMPNGNILTQAWGSLGLSNKGSSTGNVTITGFPVAAGTNGTVYFFACAQENISTSSGAQIYADMSPSATTAFVRSYVNGAANTSLTNANFTNTSVLKFYAVYWNN
jgi:hypothetical protein